MLAARAALAILALVSLAGSALPHRVAVPCMLLRLNVSTITIDSNGKMRVTPGLGGGDLAGQREQHAQHLGGQQVGDLRSERRAHEDAPYRLFDQDQTHILTVVASYRVEVMHAHGIPSDTGGPQNRAVRQFPFLVRRL